MSRMAKIILSIVAAAVALGVVTGIAFISVNWDTDKKDPAGFYIDGKMVDDPNADPLLSFGDMAVPFDVYRYFFLSSRALYEMYYGETLFTNDPDGDNLEQLKSYTESYLQTIYTWLIVAEQEGIELNEEELAEIEQNLQEMRDEYGDDLEAYLVDDAYYSSIDNYLEIQRLMKLYSKAQEEYTEKMADEYGQAAADEAEANYLENNMTVQHILIMADTETDDMEQAKADALVIAEDIVDQLRAVDDVEEQQALFFELQAEYTDDVDSEGNPNSPDGYTFTEDDSYVPIFIETSKELEIDEISDPVWNEPEEGYSGYYGWHIILRLPLDENGIEAARETASSTIASEKVTEHVAEIQEAYPVVYGSHYKTLKADNIR